MITYGFPTKLLSAAALTMALTFPAIELSAAETSATLAPSAIKDVMRRAADYQLQLQADDKATSITDHNYEWVLGAFYTGVMALYEATGDEKYLNAALNYGKAKDWQLDKPETRHADWQCIGQTYMELYLLKKDPQMMAGIKKNIDAQMATPQPGRVDWWWCDALYMAPPVLVRLHEATGDKKYLEYLNTMYWDTVDFLYNEEEDLFFRDKTFFETTTTAGTPAFWSRGNGWVLAGLPRVLDYLPEDDPGRPKYEALFKDMSKRIAGLQQPDGLWRSSLTAPEDFPTSETSGTAFFTYAMAWGINNGLLDRAKFEPVVKKGWTGLTRAVDANGRLGYVQAVAAAPGTVDPGTTREYAVGAFLLAGNEMLKLQK